VLAGALQRRLHSREEEQQRQEDQLAKNHWDYHAGQLYILLVVNHTQVKDQLLLRCAIYQTHFVGRKRFPTMIYPLHAPYSDHPGCL